jgi:hypothetical protein
MKRRNTLGVTALAAVAVIAIAPGTGWGSSHSDAPLIKQDPQANLTDVYAFIGNKYDDSGARVLNVVVHVRPFSEPGDGVMFDRFADDALYSIHIANPATGASLMRYDFEFSPVNRKNKNPDTLLSYGRGTEIGPIQDVGDARQNFTQTYSVTRVVRHRRTVLAAERLTPPPNVGGRTTPFYNDANGKAVSGAADFDALDRYTQQTVFGLATGEAVFAGPRDDGFFADTAGIFDLLDPRILGADGLGQTGNGVDGFKGFNVLAFAIQIPVSQLPALSYTSPFFGAQTGVGVYASVSRRFVTVRTEKLEPQSGGPWVQVNRMANPLFNEALVALRDKDNYNRTSPSGDAAFAKYARTPELATLINAVFGTAFAADNRADLVAVYIPDVIRVNTSTEPVRLPGQTGFSRLGFLGGDTTSGVSGGWPNGRRLGDDVVDIALTAIASGPAYATVTVLGDNVAANDQAYNQVFPYSATPHAGPTNRKDPTP